MSAPLIPLVPAVEAFLAQPHKGMHIDGRSVPAHSGRTLPVCNPADGQVIAHVPDADAEDIDMAVSAARRAFESRNWRLMRPTDRERALLRLADLIEAHGDELAQLETLNQGKPLSFSQAADVGATAQYVRYMAGWATKIEGATRDVSTGTPDGQQFMAFTRREPVGVVAAITPWNFSIMMPMWKIAPALACGCTIVLKPAEQTPLTMLRMAELILEAGFPPGAVNVVTGYGETAGAALVRHPSVDKISFTGSTAVGKAIGRQALDNMTRLSLELGGKNPMIVLGDADLNAITFPLVMAAFANQGQICAAGSRLYVHNSQFDALVAAMSAAAATLRVGPGLSPDTMIGPVVSQAHQRHILRYIDETLAAGGQAVLGGDAPDRPGYFVNPTILVNTRSDMPVVREEVFGPVLVAMPFDDLDAVIAEANNTPYGLTASIWTNNLKQALDAIPRLKAGTVYVNSHSLVDPNMPFGGFKQSGFGREHGREMIDAYTETKAVFIAY